MMYTVHWCGSPPLDGCGLWGLREVERSCLSRRYACCACGRAGACEWPTIPSISRCFSPARRAACSCPFACIPCPRHGMAMAQRHRTGHCYRVRANIEAIEWPCTRRGDMWLRHPCAAVVSRAARRGARAARGAAARRERGALGRARNCHKTERWHQRFCELVEPDIHSYQDTGTGLKMARDSA